MPVIRWQYQEETTVDFENTRKRIINFKQVVPS